jgi:hypothetical protein
LFATSSVTAAGRPLVELRPVQSIARRVVSLVWVLRSHSAVSRFLGCVVFPHGAAPDRLEPDASSQRVTRSYRVSHERVPARRPQPSSTSHGLSVPTAHQGTAVHLTRACQPATFRLQGLVTLLTAYSRRARASLVSCRQRSWDSPFGAFSSCEVHAAFAVARTHLPFKPSVVPPPEGDGPAQRAAAPGL